MTNLEKRTRKFLGDSVSVQGVTFDKIDWTGYEELGRAILDYYAGKGFPLEVWEKYFTGSITIHPKPKYLRKVIMTN